MRLVCPRCFESSDDDQVGSNGSGSRLQCWQCHEWSDGDAWDAHDGDDDGDYAPFVCAACGHEHEPGESYDSEGDYRECSACGQWTHVDGDELGGDDDVDVLPDDSGEPDDDSIGDAWEWDQMLEQLEAILDAHDEMQGGPDAGFDWRADAAAEAEELRYAEMNREAWEEIAAFLAENYEDTIEAQGERGSSGPKEDDE